VSPGSSRRQQQQQQQQQQQLKEDFNLDPHESSFLSQVG